MNNDVSVIVSITAAAALTYGVVIWRARVVAQRMEEDVSNVWIGDGTPMVSVDNIVICFLYYYFICGRGKTAYLISVFCLWYCS